MGRRKVDKRQLRLPFVEEDKNIDITKFITPGGRKKGKKERGQTSEVTQDPRSEQERAT